MVADHLADSGRVAASSQDAAGASATLRTALGDLTEHVACAAPPYAADLRETFKQERAAAQGVKAVQAVGSVRMEM